jgi:hypothetical protein
MTTPATPPPPAPVPPAIHELKTWPEYFDAVRDGRKTFEIRRNDRGFKVGDVLVLQEFDPETQKYSGEMASFCVTYLTDFGQTAGNVVMGIVPWTECPRHIHPVSSCPMCKLPTP